LLFHQDIFDLMKTNIFIYFTIFFFISLVSVNGQSREELEKQRAESLKQLDLTNQLLKKTQASRKATTQKVNLIDQRIKLRQSIINSIVQEVAILDSRIDETERVLEQLTNDLKSAREEYGKIVYYAYKYRSNYNKVVYLLAADNLNQAYRRLRYFQQISQFRKRQIGVINSLSASITEKIIELQIERSAKVQLLRDHRSETIALNQEKTSFSREVNQLSRKERELRDEINKQKKIAQQLEKAIKTLIEEEAKRIAARKEIGLTPAEKIISDNFRNNKGGLPWPTEKGVIISFFGEHPHPVLKGIKIQNNGIDILTTEGANARAIFKGEVRKVIHIPGMNRGIIIRHGNYLTVYTNLSDVYVKAGDMVETKQNIGKIYTDKSDGSKTMLHLEIWEESTKLDPISWISR
jgi:murein hydrolase activator